MTHAVLGVTSLPEFRVVRSASTARRKKVKLVPADEVWLWRNAEAMASVDRGLAQMGRGETVDLGSFADYADVEIDD